jgi:serine/threonine protein phosphatase 1
MATIAIGDIHGSLDALSDLLNQLRNELAPEDVVVFLGDYIDRGPDSRGCIDAILAFREERRADVVCLMGNHEDWLLRTASDYTRHSWLTGMEGLDTIQSYSAEAAAAIRAAQADAGLAFYLSRCPLPYDLFFDEVPASHRAFFERLALCFEGPDCFCSHAGVDPAVSSLADQPPDALVWGRQRFPAEYSGTTPVVYGHWNDARIDPAGWPQPRLTPTTIGVDTIAHGILTAIRMPDRRVFQSARYPSFGGVV